jgi:hypothetical protein
LEILYLLLLTGSVKLNQPLNRKPVTTMTDPICIHYRRLPVWRFLMAPEDSSPPRQAAGKAGRPIWQGLKTMLWIVLSVVAALIIGQF